MAIKYKLFLSCRLVTERDIFDGGVLVDEDGVIDKIINRKEAEILIASKENIEVIDGGDLALLAGVVDSHVHVNEPGRTAWEGFRTATNAAAAGGITTIVDMPLNSIPPTTTLENLKIKASSAEGNVYVDVGFWGGVIVGNQDSLKDLVEAGVVGFKCFLCPSGVDEFPNVGRQDLELAFEALEGTDSVLAFHAELEDDDETSENKIQKRDPEEYKTYLESRPPKMEFNAITLITSCLPKTSVRVHIVHVSSASVVPLLNKARKDRIAKGNSAWRGGVTAETCHHYLTLSAEEIPRGHSEYKCAPPIRDTDNKEELWKYLLEDKLDMVVSDHSPCTPNLKCTNNLEAWGGISSVQFGLSLFWTQASARGLDMTAITKYLSTAPATLCGLQHRKGALKPGLDADLVFFDPDDTFTVTSDIIRHKNKDFTNLFLNVNVELYHRFQPYPRPEKNRRNKLSNPDLKNKIYLNSPKLDVYVRNYGRPDLFITMTCIPAWPEVTRELIPGQNSTARHDITARLTPYIGRDLKGVVKKTFLRGQLIYDGEVIGDPKGKLLLK